MPATYKTVGQHAYEAYRQDHLNGATTMPSWESLSAAEISAWNAAGLAIYEYATQKVRKMIRDVDHHMDEVCEKATPIGTCSGCGTPVYSTDGFCGVCGRL